jgi:16S rRNA (guanine527-N7)-methyltransferase
MHKNPSLFTADELKKLEELSKASGATVPPGFVSRSERFLAELIRWNKALNLVSRRDEQRVLDHHLLDSLCLLSVEPRLAGKRIMDVGSGAGFPGLVLALWEPKAQVVLVESIGKKVAFLKAVRRLLGMDNVLVVHGRVEKWVQSDVATQPIDIVVSRGVGNIRAVVVALSDSIAERGMFVLYKGDATASALIDPRGKASFKELGFKLDIVKPVWPSRTRLIVLRRTHQTK